MVTLDEFEEQISELPLLPMVAYELCKADPEDADFFEDLYRLASSDPSLATLIISSANSAISSPAVSVLSLKSALTRVGSKSAYRLVVLSSVSKVFLPTQPQHKDLWLHSVEVGILTSHIHRLLYDDQEEAELAYLCGLLHDIGRLVMFQFSPEIIDEVEASNWKIPEELVDIENTHLGFDHTSLGYLAGKKMQLPSVICNIIKYHHSVRALRHPKVPDDLKRILLCLQVADAISAYIARYPEWSLLPDNQLLMEVETTCMKGEWVSIKPVLPEVCRKLKTMTKTALEQTKALGL